VLHNKAGEVKLFNLFGHFNLLILISLSILNAQTFENFKHLSSDSFVNYKDKRDVEFSKYLNLQFKAYPLVKPELRYKIDKPSAIPLSMSKSLNSVGPVVNIRIKKQKNIEKKQNHKQKKNKKDISFDFFGTNLGFNIPDGLRDAKYYPQNQKGIRNFFNKSAASEYDNLLVEIQNISKKMNLNDWAIYLLVNKLSKNTLTNSDDVKLLSWFLLNKMGYSVKVGIISKRIVLMFYSKKIIYATPSYIFNNKRYYLISQYSKSSLLRVYSYIQDYPSSNKELDLSLSSLPKFEEDIKIKTLKFKIHAKKYEFDISYNKNIINFMDTYPQVDYETFFNAPMENRTYEDIVSALKKYINSKHASTAINFVLNFVQNAFVYEKDIKQFNREKVMFAQEVLFYDKSDCDDRAVLFSYLIKKLFSITVIGLKYDDHMSTALYIPMKGDSVRLMSKRFIVADPSYINASIGQSIAKYKSIKPTKFIMINKD